MHKGPFILVFYVNQESKKTFYPYRLPPANPDIGEERMRLCPYKFQSSVAQDGILNSMRWYLVSCKVETYSTLLTVFVLEYW